MEKLRFCSTDVKPDGTGQFFDARSVDGRSDLYSVAVMLYELLAGRPPFKADSYAQLVVKVSTEAAPPLATVAAGLPPASCEVIDKGLAGDQRLSPVS